MLDIYPKEFLILLANFLFLIFALNHLLFKPLLKVFGERENTVKGALEAAKAMNERKEDALSRMTRELAEARQKARDTFESLKGEGLQVQQGMLSDAESAAAAMLQRAREELKAESEKARQRLRSDVERFSDEIVGKLVNA